MSWFGLQVKALATTDAEVELKMNEISQARNFLQIIRDLTAKNIELRRICLALQASVVCLEDRLDHLVVTAKHECPQGFVKFVLCCLIHK